MTGGKITGPDGPNGLTDSYDPFQSFSTVSSQFEAAINATFDDPEAFIDEIVEAVLEMPPEDRFVASEDVILETLSDRFGHEDTFQAVFPLGPRWIENFLDELFSKAMTEIAKDAFKTRHGGDWLVALPVLQTSRLAFSRLSGEELSDEEQNVLYSAFAALFIRLYHEIEREKADGNGNFELVATDIAYAQHVISPIVGFDTYYPPPESVDQSNAYELAVQEGAVLCYALVPISIGRGAELSDRSEAEFKRLLEQYGVTPRYGPDSVGELHSGPDLNER